MTTPNIDDFISYRLNKAEEVYSAALLLYNAHQWNSSINRLYYACFYAASALLLKRDVGAKSHGGVIAKFSENIVRTGEMTADEYRVYSKLLNWRTKGDYSDMFDFTEEDVASVMTPTRTFLDKVKQLTQQNNNNSTHE